MGSIAVTTGTVRVRDCPEVKSILKAGDGDRQGEPSRAGEARPGRVHSQAAPGLLQAKAVASSGRFPHDAGGHKDMWRGRLEEQRYERGDMAASRFEVRPVAPTI